ncbi:MAG: hypothetical protein EBR91_11335 [Flavobacteriia bacterium]|nr:hypothetical protein [Flavobacteriia bacterium]
MGYALPPILPVNDTIAELLAAKVAVPIVGAGGLVITVFDTAEIIDVPTLVVPTTVNVYAVLLDRPLTIIGDEVPVLVNKPGLLVTVYVITFTFPLIIVNATETELEFIAVAVPIIGVPGYVTILFDEDETVDVPILVLSVILNVYAVLPIKPDILIGDTVPIAVIDPGLLVRVYVIGLALPPIVPAKVIFAVDELVGTATKLVGGFG